MGAMDTDDYKMYLQNIEEYVMDENKIVTYKWLSRNLGIHVNTAKQLLYAFAKENKNKANSTYLVGGMLNDGSGGIVEVVREEDLDKIKAKLKLITSEHVYSVQKTKKLQDLNVLYSVDVQNCKDTDESKCLGGIKCNHPVLRPQEEVTALKRKTQAAAAEGNDKLWPSAKKPTSSKVEEDTTKKPTEARVQSKDENAKTEKEPKKGGIAAMFAAQSTKTSKQDNTGSKAKQNATKKPKTGGGISTFFSRLPDKPAKSSPPKNGDSSSSEPQDSLVTEDVQASNKEYDSKGEKRKLEEVKDASDDDVKGAKRKREETQNAKTKETKTKSSTSKDSSSKKENATKDSGSKGKTNAKKTSKGKSKKLNANESKKRKRILVMSDSEESSNDDREEEEDEMMRCSPPPQPVTVDDDEDLIPPTPEASGKKGHKRVRKMVDKTYMDEDGYMLTKKEYVFESCSDSESEEGKENKLKEVGETKTSPADKTSDEKASPKKKASPQKTKQASIMNFFKKS